MSLSRLCNWKSVFDFGWFHCIALLAATLRTYQRAGCENEQLTLSCPRGTSISIEIAQYGRTKGLLFISISNRNHAKWPKKRNSIFLQQGLFVFCWNFVDLADFSACSEYKPNSLEAAKTALETSEMSISTNEMCVMGQLQVGHSLNLSGGGRESH